jgi:hypothetical protein
VKVPPGEFELADRIAAITRLPETQRHLVGHLLAVEIELEWNVGAGGVDRRLSHRIGPAAGREQRQVHPVAAVDGQLPHLLGIDVDAERGRSRVHNRCFTGDGDRLLDSRGCHLQVQHGRLTDEHLDLPRHAAEARQLGVHFEEADANWDAVAALLVRHGHERIARCRVRRRNRHARQHAARRIGDRAAQDRLLRPRPNGQQRQEREHQYYAPENTQLHSSLLQSEPCEPANLCKRSGN